MAEMLLNYPSADALQEDLGLQYDQHSGFPINPDGQLISFHRTFTYFNSDLRPSSDGALGEGVYLGNSERVLSSFSRHLGMRTLLVIELPCGPAEVEALATSHRFDRGLFDKENSSRENPARLITWKPPIGNAIGCVAMRGFKGLSRNPRWGLWIDASVPIKPFAKISKA